MISIDPTPTPKSSASCQCQEPFKRVYSFTITLRQVKPSVWRRIEVPDSYSFWDLHVAITDAFGWTDSHLHEFSFLAPKSGNVLLGIPDEDEAEGSVLPDWEHRLSDYIKDCVFSCDYQYDFGDGWSHLVWLDGDTKPRKKNLTYPRCVTGQNACPPDDCGGPAGYAELLKAVKKAKHPDHERMVQWLEGMKGPGFDPAHFDPAEVQFDDPKKRWQVAIKGKTMTPDMRCWKFFSQQGG